MNIKDSMFKHVITNILYEVASEVRVNGEVLDKSAFAGYVPLITCHLMLGMQQRFPSVRKIQLIDEWLNKQPSYECFIDGQDVRICDVDALPSAHKLVVILLVQNMFTAMLQPDNSINLTNDTILFRTNNKEDPEDLELNSIIKSMLT